MKKPLWSYSTRNFSTRHTINSKTNRTLGKTSNFQELICKHCQKLVRDSMYQIWQAHSDEVRTSCSEDHQRQTWLKDSFSFLRVHIRRKGVSKSFTFKSPLRPSATTVSVPDISQDTESEMEISMASDVTHRSQVLLWSLPPLLKI